MLGPIFYRELLTVPRRGRHYLVRSLYLFVLWVLALTAWQAAFGWGKENSLGDLAYFGTLVFQLLSFLQLTLVLFFSALFAAAAVTQEKDKHTFLLLLMTDLRNYEVVLGKLFGSLLPIGILVTSAVPVLAFTTMLGGVSFEQVLLAFAVLAASALAAGSLGCVLALWREKTFQTIALTVLSLVLYILIIEGLAVLPAVFNVAAESVQLWQTRLNPYRALHSVVEPVIGGAASFAVYHFVGLMGLFAFAMNGLGIFMLRIWNPRGEPIQQRETAEDAETGVAGVNVHAAPGRIRPVWHNPVLWKEVRTRGYGRRPLLIKAAYLLVFGMLVFWVASSLRDGAGGDRLMPAWGLVPLVVLSLLLLNAQSVTSITSERDLRSLDLLLVTDLSPKEFIFGKLGGMLWNTKEIILPPLVFAVLYYFWGKIGGETLFYIVIALITLVGFTATLGLHVSLRTISTKVAVGYSLGTVFFLFVGTLICIYLILVSGRFEYQWTSFLFFLAVGIGGFWWVLAHNKPSSALSLASWLCPLGVFYTITNIIIGNPHDITKSGDPLWPFLVITLSFAFTIAAMLVPLLSEFDIAQGYTGPAEE